MGIVSLSLSQSNNMKFLLVLAVAAYVKAEADPAFVYSTAGVIPHVLPYAHYPYAYYGKRSADAEPEAKADADPYLLYGGYYRPYAYHAGYYPYSYGYPYAYGLWGKK